MLSIVSCFLDRAFAPMIAASVGAICDRLMSYSITAESHIYCYQSYILSKERIWLHKDASELAKVLSSISKNDDTALTGLFALTPAQMSLLSSVLGLLFAEGLDLDQQNSLGNFIVGIGTSILVSAAQGQLIEAHADPAAVMQRQLQALKKQVDALQKRIDRR